VLANAFIVQPFTDYIFMGGSMNLEEGIIRLTKIFTALNRAGDSLMKHYGSLQRPGKHNSGHVLPCPSLLSPFPENLGVLTFLHELKSNAHGAHPSSTLFSATLTKNNETIRVVVKFCISYGNQAHDCLASRSLAPKLHFCGPVVGGMLMVIMDEVIGKTVHEAYRGIGIPKSIIDQVERAIKELHSEGFVFGDLRRPNIMIVGSSSRKRDSEGTELGLEVKLIDFDWAGDDGVARFPWALNISGDIKWAEGIEPGAIIKKEHDKRMLEILRAASL
jgi:serine/threonine protein kinase